MMRFISYVTKSAVASLDQFLSNFYNVQLTITNQEMLFFNTKLLKTCGSDREQYLLRNYGPELPPSLHTREHSTRLLQPIIGICLIDRDIDYA